MKDERERAYLLDRRERALRYARADPEVCLTEIRKATEAICKCIWQRKTGELPTIRGLDELLLALRNRKAIPGHMEAHFRAIQFYGNYGSHDQYQELAHTLSGATITAEYVRPSFHALEAIFGWYFGTHLEEALAPPPASRRPDIDEPSGIFSLAALQASAHKAQSDTDRPPAPAVDSSGVPSGDADAPPRRLRVSSQALPARELAANAFLPGIDPILAARTAISVGRRAEAILILSEALDRSNACADHQRALEAAELLVGVDPASASKRTELAELLVGEGFVERAVGELHTAVAHLEAQGRRGDLARVWERIAYLAPDDREAHRRLAIHYVESRDFQRALRTLNRWLGFEAQSPELLELSARTMEGLGNRNRARQIWEAIARDAAVAPELAAQAQLHVDRLA